MSGEKKSFSDYLGSTLVVNFWYMNCGPCLIEMPALNQLVEDYKESDINFLSFTFDKKEDLEIFFKNTEFNRYMSFHKRKCKTKHCQQSHC